MNDVSSVNDMKPTDRTGGTDRTDRTEVLPGVPGAEPPVRGGPVDGPFHELGGAE